MNVPRLASGAKKVVRDAARAAKRTAGMIMKRVSASTLSDLLGLPGMVVTEYGIEKQEEREVLRIFCRHENEVVICPVCNGISTSVHESEERCIRHLDIWGKATYVHFLARRFECKKCKKPFSEELTWIEEKRRTSTNYELHIYEQSQHSTIEAVAKREGLHPETVRSIFGRWAQRAEKKQERRVVRCLGIDEISLRQGHQHFRWF
jgi:transposase